MDTNIAFSFIVSGLVVLFYFVLNKRAKSSKVVNLPPGPPKLPIIGNIHQLAGLLPHRAFRDMSRKHGPIMHIQLGQVSTVVISSPRLAKEVLKTHDIALADRPKTFGSELVLYGNTDIALASYSEYWRQLKKISSLELLSAKKVRSFGPIREQELKRFIEFLHLSSGKPVNLHQAITEAINNVVCIASFGKNCTHRHSLAEDDLLDVLLKLKKEGGLEFPITNNNIKAIFVDIFAGGTDTSTVTIGWAMTEMIRHPSVMEKAQAEVRQYFKGKRKIMETDIQGLSYLKSVIKETLRLHPPIPLLLPHVCREQCKVGGYDIPVKMKVIVNGWACSTDPEYWEDADTFKPERFENTPIDFMGTNYHFIPFGSGRRMCPGINFGMVSVELFLAQMLYNFNWKLPVGLSPADIDMTESEGLLTAKKVHLYLIPTPYAPDN
nr:costunolide synthase-like [Tanacetum cinerariifolium]